MQNATIQRIVKFLVSGGSGAVVNLGTFYILTSLLNVWYPFAAIISFLVAFCISFTLQRMWAFGHQTLDDLTQHMSLYFLIQVFNLAMNVVLLMIAVRFFGMSSLMGQVVVNVFIAAWSFVLYKNYVFVSKNPK